MKKLSNIVLYTALALSGIWIVLLTLGAFEVFNLSAVTSANFNYIEAYIIVIVALLIYIAFLFIEKIKTLFIPYWFKILFFVAFFVFTNVYYLFGWWETIIGTVMFDIYLAVLLNILAVSLFYNTQKDDRNTVKVSDKFLVFSCFAYAAAGSLIYELTATIIRMLTKTTGVGSSLALVVTEISVYLCVCFVFSLVYSLSLHGNRKVINACLIKVNAKTK